MISHYPVLAFLGGSVGAGEWVVLFVVVLIVVGPKRLPELARKFGRTMEMFRRAADEFKDQLMNMDQEPKSEGTSSTSDSSPSDTTDSGGYENPYPDVADYPGNEDQVNNWSSGSTDGADASASAPTTDDAPAAPTADDASAAPANDAAAPAEQDKPAEPAP